MQLKNLEDRIAMFLNLANFESDACYNGLQVESTTHVKKIAFAASPTLTLIQEAARQGCDTLITHHGLYWKKQQAIATGVLGQRLSLLMKSSINLLSYHLPLDCHREVGNNAQLGLQIPLQSIKFDDNILPKGLVYTGRLDQDKLQLFDALNKLGHYPCQVYDFSPTKKEYSVAWCTGSGADFMESAAADIFITGEASERHFAMARELQCCLILAGHWQTEIWGVKALSQWTKNTLGIASIFIDEKNPL